LAASQILSVFMSKHFRPWKIDQTQLLPPSVQDFVAEDHLARFVVALVRESLDLGEITGSYTSSLGQPPFRSAADGGAAAPRLLQRHLLLAAYRQGVWRAGRLVDRGARRAGFPAPSAISANGICRRSALCSCRS
jgi:hypothetical protein